METSFAFQSLIFADKKVVYHTSLKLLKEYSGLGKTENIRSP